MALGLLTVFDQETQVQKTEPEYVIVGAGISGLYLALRLASAGKTVQIIEKRSYQQLVENTGVSVNFTLSHRGLSRLAKADLTEKVIRLAQPLKGREVNLDGGHRFFQPYHFNDGVGIYSIRRTDLIKTLLDQALKQPTIEVLYQTEMTSMNKLNKTLCLKNLITGAAAQTRASQLVIGADGVFSKVRQHLLLGEMADFELKFFRDVYTEFTLTSDIAPAVPLDRVSFFQGPQFFIVGLPNKNRSITFNVLYPKNHSLAQLTEGVCQLEAFEPHRADIQLQLQTKKPMGIPLVKTNTWYFKNNVVLVGESSHSCAHFLAQGMNSCLEDSDALYELLEKNQFHESPADLGGYQEERRKQTDTLGTLTESHYAHIKNHMFSISGLGETQLQTLAYRLSGRKLLSPYSKIVNTSSPYASVQRYATAYRRLFASLGGSLASLILGAGIYFRSLCSKQLSHSNSPMVATRRLFWK